MLEGCRTQTRAGCPVFGLLRQYGVDYVEIDDRIGDAGIFDSRVDVTWWATQGFTIVAHGDHLTVYDVRAR